MALVQRYVIPSQGQRLTVYRIDADVNAAMNLVRRFLTRYRTFTYLTVYLFGRPFRLEE